MILTLRHRLWLVTDEMGEALKRMSGSPVVTGANDFDFDFCDELGQEVQVDLAIYWTLRHRSANPGIAEGDMFLRNDPWAGGGLHQNDVADLWVRRSRVPLLIGLDLRAKIGANNVGRERLHALIGQRPGRRSSRPGRLRGRGHRVPPVLLPLVLDRAVLSRRPGGPC